MTKFYARSSPCVGLLVGRSAQNHLEEKDRFFNCRLAGPSYAGRAMPARGAGAAARTVWGSYIRRAATHATGEGHTHWHRVWRG